MSSTNRVVIKRATDKTLEHVAGLNLPVLKELRDELKLTNADVKRLTSNPDAVEIARRMYKDLMRIAFKRPGYDWNVAASIQIGDIPDGTWMQRWLNPSCPTAVVTADANDLVTKIEYSQTRGYRSLTWVSNGQLGLTGEAISFAETCMYAQFQGLKLCQGEDAPQFTIQYPRRGFPVPQVLPFAMTPVEGKIFTVDWHKGRERSMPCLATVVITPETVFSSETWFAFEIA